LVLHFIAKDFIHLYSLDGATSDKCLPVSVATGYRYVHPHSYPVPTIQHTHYTGLLVVELAVAASNIVLTRNIEVDRAKRRFLVLISYQQQELGS